MKFCACTKMCKFFLVHSQMGRGQYLKWTMSLSLLLLVRFLVYIMKMVPVHLSSLVNYSQMGRGQCSKVDQSLSLLLLVGFLV